MDREPRASTLFGARTGILANEIDTIKASRSISRCLPSSLFLEYVSLLADAFVRAAAGLLARGGHREVEPVDYRAPLRVMLHVGSATRRVDRAGAVPIWLIFGRALRSCAALFMLLRFGATIVCGCDGPSSSIRGSRNYCEGGQAGVPAIFETRRDAPLYRCARRDFWWTSLASGRRSYASRASDVCMERDGLAGAAGVVSTMEAGPLPRKRGGGSSQLGAQPDVCGVARRRQVG